MSHIKSKDTSIELKVRKYLFAQGFRYRVNYKLLAGKPDIVFPKKRIAIFVHGCYWHGHDCESRYAHKSRSNTEYWSSKILRTKARDASHIHTLEESGWNVIVIWECQIKQSFDATMEKLIFALQ